MLLTRLPHSCTGVTRSPPDVTIVRRVQPPSQPPPAGGRRRVPAPSGGRVREGAVTVPTAPWRGRDARAPRLCSSGVVRPAYGAERDCGGTGFPHPPARGRAWPSSRGLGKPGFPTFPPAEGLGGRSPCAGVWGNPVSPDPTRWESVGGRSPPKVSVPIILRRVACNHPVGERGKPGFPLPLPLEVERGDVDTNHLTGAQSPR